MVSLVEGTDAVEVVFVIYYLYRLVVLFYVQAWQLRQAGPSSSSKGTWSLLLSVIDVDVDLSTVYWIAFTAGFVLR